MAKVDANDAVPAEPPNGSGVLALLGYRVTQLELRAERDQQDELNWRTNNKQEVERRRDAVDKTIEKLEGDLQATRGRLDLLVAKITIWASLVAAVIGFFADILGKHFFK